MAALSSAVLRKINDFIAVDTPQESYAVVWGLWRTHDPSDVASAFEEDLFSGFFADALVHGLLLSDCEWRASAAAERRLQVALGRGLPPSSLRALWLWNEAYTLPSPIIFDSMYHVYKKLSKCIDHVTAGTQLLLGSRRVLERIESFGQDVGQWLKVAGGDKAFVTEDALLSRPPHAQEVSVEFGAFVGYSGIRFARCILAAAASLATCGWVAA